MILILLFLLTHATWAATIHAQLDRNPVNLNESFRLIFEAEGNLDAAPDFSPLEKDFSIVRRSQGSSMQIINGNISNKTQWDLVLLSKQVGTFTIPPISFGKDTSPAITIEVKQPQQTDTANSNLFLKVDVNKNEAYIQSQIIYTVRLYRAVNIGSASLSEPELSGTDAIVEKLGDDREFETRLNGRPYRVIERSYAIFPQQSGNLHIPPITFEGQIIERPRSMFDPFSQNARIKRLQSDGLDLNVKSIPASFTGKTWLPAKNLRLVEEWSNDADPITTGEPVTRILTLIADGLTAAQLPEIVIPNIDKLKQYPDQATLKDEKQETGIMGVRQEKIALIPTQAGNYSLPAIEIPWWNVDKDRQEVATVPAQTFTATTSAVETSMPAMTGKQLTSSNDREQTPIAESTEPGTTVGKTQDPMWFWISIALAAGWFSTAFAWVASKRRQRGKKRETEKETNADLAAIKRAIKQSCLQNDPVACKSALLIWGKHRWPEDPPKNISAIAIRVDSAFKEELAKLNDTLYRTQGDWQGEQLWQTFLNCKLDDGQQKEDNTDEVLAPLYQ
ncbi:MAG: BatD family protein [Gammaproteobacteria bacterium]